MTTTLAAWIIQQLQDLEKSQADFSTEAGIPKANVHYILAKGHIPGHETLQRIADYFKVSILYVVSACRSVSDGNTRRGC